MWSMGSQSRTRLSDLRCALSVSMYSRLITTWGSGGLCRKWGARGGASQDPHPHQELRSQGHTDGLVSGEPAPEAGRAGQGLQPSWGECPFPGGFPRCWAQLDHLLSRVGVLLGSPEGWQVTAGCLELTTRLTCRTGQARPLWALHPHTALSRGGGPRAGPAGCAPNPLQGPPRPTVLGCSGQPHRPLPPGPGATASSQSTGPWSLKLCWEQP